jgi:homoserine O-acetyltransferase
MEKKVFSLPSYTTVGGKTIKDEKIGMLNAAGENATFIAHFFSGKDSIIGADKPGCNRHTS